MRRRYPLTRKQRAPAILAGLTSLVLAACTVAEDDGTSSAPSPAEDAAQQDPSEPLECVVGATPPLSGANAANGEQQVMGGDLAAKHVNENGNVTITMAYRDGENLPEPNIAGFRALASQGATAVIVGGTGPLLALEPLAPNLETIVVNVAATTPAQREMNEWVFAIAALADTEAEQILSELQEQLGVSSVAVIKDDDDFGDMFAGQLERAAGELGVEVAEVVPVELGAADLRSQLRPLTEVDVDAIVLAVAGATAGTAVTQAKDIGVEAEYWVGQSFTWIPDALDAAGSAAEGSIATTQLFDEDATTVSSDFLDSFREEYGQDPSSQAARAYDVVSVVAQAAEQAGSCDPGAVRAELETITDFEGVTGSLSFTDRIAALPLLWGQVQDGAVVPVSLADVE